jgi:sortase A
VRRLGTIFLVVGLVAIAYAAATIFWRDPVTDLYARWKQHQLADSLAESAEAFRADARVLFPPIVATTSAQAPPELDRKMVRSAARVWRKGLERGDALGRIVIPKIGIDPVFVNGTRWGADLSKGPGQYERTTIPGLGSITAIAGHRTTFGAPFRHIDDLEAGDTIRLEMPYGTFRYVVVEHEIVSSDDWSILDERGYDLLVLSACHPLYSSSQRWIVYARLAEYEAPSGASYHPSDAEQLEAAANPSGG